METPEKIAAFIANANSNASSEGWEKVYSAALSAIETERKK